MFIHSTVSFLVTPDKDTEETADGEATDVSYLVFLPVCACMLVNGAYSYLQIATTPYLLEEFNIPLSVGGTVLAVVSAGVAIGSTLSGAIAQRGIVNVYTQMGIGSLMVAAGLLIMFPSPAISFIYTNIPYIAYPAGFLTGVGDPIITVATLRAMTELQSKVKGACEGKTYINIFGIWLVGFSSAGYFGTFAGGILLQWLSYRNGTHLLASLCGLSVAISVVTRVIVGRITTQENQRLLEKRGNSIAPL